MWDVIYKEIDYLLYLVILLLLGGILIIIVYWIISSVQEPITETLTVGFFRPGPNYQGVSYYPGVPESLEYGINDVANQRVILIKYIFNDNDELASLITDFERIYSNNRRVIVSGYTTNQLLKARQTLDELGSNTLAISIGSSYILIENQPGIVSMMYSDNIASTTLLMYARLNNTQNLVILYDDTDQYAIGYKDLILNKYSIFNIQTVTTFGFQGGNEFSLNTVATQLLSTVDNSSLVIYIGNSIDLYSIAKFGKFTKNDPNPFPENVKIACTDACQDLTDYFTPTLDICVNIPYAADYTSTTRSLYQRLLTNNPNNLNFYSFLCPFAYDCGYKLGLLSQADSSNLDERTLFITLNPQIPAALSAINMDSVGRPTFGNYVSCYTKNPPFIPEIIGFRKTLEGAIQTLPDGADIPFRYGKYSWTGITEYAFLVNNWETYNISTTNLLPNKMSVQSADLSANTKLGYNEYVWSIAMVEGQVYVPADVPIHITQTTVNFK